MSKNFLKTSINILQSGFCLLYKNYLSFYRRLHYLWYDKPTALKPNQSLYPCWVNWHMLCCWRNLNPHPCYLPFPLFWLRTKHYNMVKKLSRSLWSWELFKWQLYPSFYLLSLIIWKVCHFRHLLEFPEPCNQKHIQKAFFLVLRISGSKLMGERKDYALRQIDTESSQEEQR